MDQPSESGDRAVIATIIGAVVGVAAIGAGWIWRQGRRHRADDTG
jgi:hypothetical protein